MATESELNNRRKDVVTNIRKAGEAAVQKGQDEYDRMSPADRMTYCLAAAQTGAIVLVADRLSQILQGVYSEDETMMAAQERIRTGEQVVQRIIETVESGDLNLDDEAMTSITMAEDWLEPGGFVGFATPEAVEAGRDPHSNLDEE